MTNRCLTCWLNNMMKTKLLILWFVLVVGLGLCSAVANADIHERGIVNHDGRNQVLLNRLGQRLGFDVRMQQLDTDHQHDKTWTMTLQSGEPVHCTIETEQPHVQVKVSPTETAPARLTKEMVLENVKKQMNSLGRSCLRMNKGYWTYEYCHLDQIYQFHGNGRFDAGTVWSLGIHDGKRNDEVGVVDGKYVHVSYPYIGGQFCDETQKPRESRAFFYCCPKDEVVMDGYQNFKLESIEEHGTCNYTVTLCSPLLCEAGLSERGMVNDVHGTIFALEGLCFQKTMDWWTYRVCVGDSVTQFHLEEVVDNKGKRKLQVSTEYLLGKFVSSPSASVSRPNMLSNLKLEKHARTLTFVDVENPAVVQIYDGGSPCDVARGNRFTMVRYVCMDANASQRSQLDLNGIVEIEEISSCVYQIVFHSHLLCNNELFRKKTDQPQRMDCKKTLD